MYTVFLIDIYSFYENVIRLYYIIIMAIYLFRKWKKSLSSLTILWLILSYNKKKYVHIIYKTQYYELWQRIMIVYYRK